MYEMRNMKLSKITILALALIMAGVGVSSAYAGVFGERQQNLTDEQKAILEQVRELKEAGNYEEARELAQEVGLRNKKHRMMYENKEEVKIALENNDYSAFQELTTDKPFAGEITEEIFAKMVEAHQLRLAGDYEGAKAIHDELGLKKGYGHGGKGMRDCQNQ